MPHELPPGIRRTATGFQAYVWVTDATKPKGGFQAAKRYGPSATITEMKQWRVKRQLKIAETIPDVVFRQDALDYLQREKVLRMPTALERVNHVYEWIALFGHRDRKTIQPQEIQKALDGMRARMAAGSVNKRRTALMDLWTTLDGKHQANPVKATKAYDEPTPEPRAPSLLDVLRIINSMPTGTDYARKCKARITVIAWTGWPHKILKQLEPGDIDWKGQRAYVRERTKGKGSPARWVPLLPQAITALKALKKAHAFGHFSNSSLHKKFTVARDAMKLPHVRPYDFRHFFGTLIATLTRDERAVQELMLLRTPKMARRYTEAATNPRTQAAVKDVAKAVPGLLKAAGRIGRVSPLKMNLSKPERASNLPESRRKTRNW